VRLLVIILLTVLALALLGYIHRGRGRRWVWTDSAADRGRCRAARPVHRAARRRIRRPTSRYPRFCPAATGSGSAHTYTVGSRPALLTGGHRSCLRVHRVWPVAPHCRGPRLGRCREGACPWHGLAHARLLLSRMFTAWSPLS